MPAALDVLNRCLCPRPLSLTRLLHTRSHPLPFQSPYPHTDTFPLKTDLPLQRLLDYIKPEFVHIMEAGRITQTGGMDLVDQLEAGGYATLTASA